MEHELIGYTHLFGTFQGQICWFTSAVYSFIPVGSQQSDPIHYQAYYTDDEHPPIIIMV